MPLRDIVSWATTPDEGTVRALNEGELPVNEPGLEELITAGMRKGLLRFSSIPEEISGSDILWVAYDTPVDEEDRADVDFVIGSVCSLFPHIRGGALNKARDKVQDAFGGMRVSRS